MKYGGTNSCIHSSVGKREGKIYLGYTMDLYLPPALSSFFKQHVSECE